MSTRARKRARAGDSPSLCSVPSTGWLLEDPQGPGLKMGEMSVLRRAKPLESTVRCRHPGASTQRWADAHSHYLGGVFMYPVGEESDHSWKDAKAEAPKG